MIRSIYIDEMTSFKEPKWYRNPRQWLLWHRMLRQIKKHGQRSKLWTSFKNS